MTVDAFLGEWEFDPSQAHYEFGTPPQSGVYRIELQGDALKFTAEWIDASGQSFQISYFSVPDGLERPYENPAVADTLKTTMVSENQMDTETKKNGVVVALANRILSPDGQSMLVSQAGTTPQGTPFKNDSVYLKR